MPSPFQHALVIHIPVWIYLRDRLRRAEGLAPSARRKQSVPGQRHWASARSSWLTGMHRGGSVTNAQSVNYTADTFKVTDPRSENAEHRRTIRRVTFHCLTRRSHTHTLVNKNAHLSHLCHGSVVFEPGRKIWVGVCDLYDVVTNDRILYRSQVVSLHLKMFLLYGDTATRTDGGGSEDARECCSLESNYRYKNEIEVECQGLWMGSSWVSLQGGKWQGAPRTVTFTGWGGKTWQDHDHWAKPAEKEIGSLHTCARTHTRRPPHLRGPIRS